MGLYMIFWDLDAAELGYYRRIPVVAYIVPHLDPETPEENLPDLGYDPTAPTASDVKGAAKTVENLPPSEFDNLKELRKNYKIVEYMYETRKSLGSLPLTIQSE